MSFVSQVNQLHAIFPDVCRDAIARELMETKSMEATTERIIEWTNS